MLNQPDQFEDILDCYAPLTISDDAPVVVALSGGSDSSALLFSLKTHLAKINSSADIIAVTIDHGLRPESAEEAKQVGDWCKQLGIAHFIKRWSRDADSGGVQAAARLARYMLLSEVAREHGSQFVLAGHSLNDQLETIAMRVKRGEGRGLAGIPIATLFDRTTWFVRPLLGCTRDRLRSFLSAHEIGWVDDPSNDNPAFERVRVRQTRFSKTRQQELREIQAAAMLERERVSAAGAQLLANPMVFDFDRENNEGRLNLSAIEDLGFEAAMQTMMCKIGARSHFAKSEVVDQIYDFARSGRKAAKFTAHGCLFSIHTGWLVANVEKRANRREKYCYDHLIPNADWALANALNLRLNRAELPLMPVKTATR